MFCPNCGTNCGEANFCYNCGTKLAANVLNQNSEKDSFDIPYGRYGDFINAVILYDGELIAKNSGLFGKYEVSIPYEKLTRVEYVRPFLKGKGELSIFWEPGTAILKSGKAVPNECRHMIFLIDSDEENALYYHLFWMLKAILSERVQFHMDIAATLKERITKTSQMRQSLNMDAYFEEFSPYRKRAVEELWAKARIPAPDGRAIINKAFDERQEALYRENPSLAIRDMNRVLDEIQRLKEIKEQEEKLRQIARSARSTSR